MTMTMTAIESVEQFDALPNLTIIGVKVTLDEFPPNGGLLAMQRDCGDWYTIGEQQEVPLDRLRETIAEGGCVVLWAPEKVS